MDNLPSEPLPFNPHTTIGALEIGVLVSMSMFGVTCAQVYTYLSRCAKDHWLFKALVAVVWLLEVAHSIAACHYLYTVTVSQYARPQLLLVAPLSFDTIIVLNGLMGFLEHSWFIRRLYVFSRNVFLTIICCIFALARIGFTMTIAALAFQRPTFPEYIAKWWWLTTCAVVMGGCTDILIVVSSLFLSFPVQEIQFQARKDNRPSRRLHYCIGGTALLTCFLVMPFNFIWIGVFVLLPRLFANAVLFSLNFRDKLAQLFGQAPSFPEVRLSRPRSGRGTETEGDYSLSPTSYQHRSGEFGFGYAGPYAYSPSGPSSPTQVGSSTMLPGHYRHYEKDWLSLGT